MFDYRVDEIDEEAYTGETEEVISREEFGDWNAE